MELDASLIHFLDPYDLPERNDLLREGITKVNAKDQYGWTPLMGAIASRSSLSASIHPGDAFSQGAKNSVATRYDKVNLLINQGAKINAKNENGETALMLAAMMGYMQIVALLLEKGADVHTQNNQHETALHYAVFKNSTKIKVIQLLLMYGAQPINHQLVQICIQKIQAEKNILQALELDFGQNLAIFKFSHVKQPGYIL